MTAEKDPNQQLENNHRPDTREKPTQTFDSATLDERKKTDSSLDSSIPDYLPNEFEPSSFSALESLDQEWMLGALDRLKASPPPSAVGSIWSPGDLLLGRYILGRELGRGGFGVVYSGTDTKLDRKVAIKLLHPTFAKVEHYRKLFEREARAASQVNHEHVVGILTTGLTDHETPFLVMELVAGEPLKSTSPIVQQASHRQLADWVRRAALGLHAAHKAGLVHRDIKGSNILVGSDNLVKVTDFGLARLMESEESRTELAGTLSYMSPEQVSVNQTLDGRADVYSMGAVLYELIAGTPPFTGKDAAVILQILKDEPLSLRKLAPDCPFDLITIAEKCLRKDRSARYQTSKELADDLERWLGGHPIKARPVSSLERSIKWVRRYPVVTTLAALVLVALATSIVLSVSLARANQKAQETLTIADNVIRGLEESGTNSYLLASLTSGKFNDQAMISPAAKNSTIPLYRALVLAREKKWAEALPLFDEAVRLDPDRKLSRLFMILALASIDDQERWDRETLDALAKYPNEGAFLELRADLYISQAYEIIKGPPVRNELLAIAEDLLRRARSAEPGNPTYASKLAEVLTELHEFEEAKELLDFAIVTAPTIDEFRRLRDWHREQGAIEDALAIASEIVESPESNSSDLLTLARLQSQNKELMASELSFRRFLDLQAATHPDTVHIAAYNDYGIVLIGLERFDEAIDCYSQIGSEANFIINNNHGTALLGAGRMAEAIAEFERALEDPDRHRDTSLPPQLAFLVTGDLSRCLQIAAEFPHTADSELDREWALTVAFARLAEVASGKPTEESEWAEEWNQIRLSDQAFSDWNYYFLDRWHRNLPEEQRTQVSEILADLEKLVPRRFPVSEQ